MLSITWYHVQHSFFTQSLYWYSYLHLLASTAQKTLYYIIKSIILLTFEDITYSYRSHPSLFSSTFDIFTLRLNSSRTELILSNSSTYGGTPLAKSVNCNIDQTTYNTNTNTHLWVVDHSLAFQDHKQRIFEAFTSML